MSSQYIQAVYGANPGAIQNLVTVLAYGADPTGATASDDAVASALVNNTALFFPPGVYSFQRPILVTKQNTKLIGAGQGATTLQTNRNVRLWDGPGILLCDSGFADRMVVSGTEFVLDPASASPRYLNLKDVSGGAYRPYGGGGGGSYTTECFFTLDPTDAGPIGSYSWILGSMLGNNIGWAFMQFRDGGGVRFLRSAITLNGVQYAVTVAGLVTGHKYHLELDFDVSSGKATFFIDGVGTVITTQPGTTITQTSEEGVYLGDTIPSVAYNGGGTFTGCKCKLSGIRFQNIVAHSGNFSPPTSNPLLTANTLLLLNPGSFYGPLSAGQGFAAGFSSPLDLYWLPRGVPGGAVGGVAVKGFFMTGYGFGLQWSGIEGQTDDLFISAWTGIDFYQDSFLHGNSNTNLLTFGPIGMSFTGSSTGLMDIRTLNVTGGYFGIYMNTSGAIFTNVICTPNQSTVFGIVANAGGPLDGLRLNGFGLDVEQATNVLQGCIRTNQLKNLNIVNSSLFGTNFPNHNAIPVVTITANNTPSNPDCVTFENCIFSAETGATLIQQNGAGRASIVLNNCSTDGGTYTFSNDFTNIVTIGGARAGAGHILQGT